MEQTYPGGRTLEKEVFIKASPERVFRALTTREDLERWFLVKAELDLCPGGTIRFSWRPGSFEVGKILVLEPPHRLSYTWETFGPAPTTITFELSAENDGTRLHLTHTNIGTGEDWDRYYTSVNRGWSAHLADLASWLETGTCPPPGPRG
ncbi:transcriptional regulator [Dictyobacter sp. S3.2.2.5]|uniref:Transcriptional regulator n=1 Tax=Dictyobacter halimunensis TaxID=3026934 RepID=A0ABQ6G2V5_9CHLR|nr:transcriptional regulator [Dictyobacter sp. S3.2.2.5]